MKTIIKKTSVDNIDMDTINQAGEIIRQGGLVAFPTETVYGLGADALNEEAAAKIYAAKGRPSDNPLIAHIADLEMLKPLVEEIPPVAEKLMDAFWPGPLIRVTWYQRVQQEAWTQLQSDILITLLHRHLLRRLVLVLRHQVLTFQENQARL